MGLAKEVPDNSTFLVFSFIARFGQGAGSSIELTTLPNLIATKYGENKVLMVRFFQMTKVVGLTAGPFFGGLLFTFLGYQGIFLMVAALIFVKVFLEEFLRSDSEV